MARVQEYELGAEPQAVADNSDAVQAKTFVLVNMTTAATGELLGADEALGAGIPIDASEKVSFELAGGEVLFAAAPDADGVVLRVLETRAGR